MSLADIAPTAMPRSASPVGWKVALALSVALNLFFAGGVTVALLQPRPAPVKPIPGLPPTPQERLAMLATVLGITAEQSPPLAEFRTALGHSVDAGHAANHPLVTAFWAEAGKPQPDSAVLKSLFDQIQANRHGTQDQTGEEFLHFIEQLPLEKRALLVAAAADRKDPRAQLARSLVGN